MGVLHRTGAGVSFNIDRRQLGRRSLSYRNFQRSQHMARRLGSLLSGDGTVPGRGSGGGAQELSTGA